MTHGERSCYLRLCLKELNERALMAEVGSAFQVMYLNDEKTQMNVRMAYRECECVMSELISLKVNSW